MWPFASGHYFVLRCWGPEMSLGFNWLSVSHDLGMCLGEVLDVLSNEPEPCDAFVDPGFCICRFNGCIIARFMNNQISMQRGVKLRAFSSQTACWFWWEGSDPVMWKPATELCRETSKRVGLPSSDFWSHGALYLCSGVCGVRVLHMLHTTVPLCRIFKC